MLTQLIIQNYAIIDELEIDFSKKLNVITGETGAGKSIIVGALGLILGERADTAALVNKEKKCVVEGYFDTQTKKNVSKFLTDNNFDLLDELVVRREIGTNGKSRAFINDTPVNLAQLQELSSLLVDLHQQFDTQEVGEMDFQREVMDALAGNAKELNDYQTIYRSWLQVKKELEELKAQKLQFDKEADYNRFQFTELEEAGFKENELEDIEDGLKIMSNAEGIKAALNKVYNDLQESETPLVQQLKILLNQLNHWSSYHPGLPTLTERLQSAQIELQDIADDVARISNQVNYDPTKIEAFNERLSIGYKLQKKHGVNSTHQLLEIQQQLKEKLQAVLHIDEVILQKENEGHALLTTAIKMASSISNNRKKQIKPFEENVNKLLTQVGMPNAKLKVEIKAIDVNLFGIDEIEFLFDANLPAGQAGKSSHFQSIRKVASGGELSRLMLCIKSLVAQSIDLPTMIFDEIDTGISGEAAKQVAIIMKKLAARRQVISITHQPQIAGKADAHFFVYKEVVKNNSSDDTAGTSIKTNIRQLNTEERITAIAKMLSGEKPTAAAIANAREMVMN